ncbi:MAG: nitroreductase family protein [Candidatus Nanohaloarchaea archaeon]
MSVFDAVRELSSFRTARDRPISREKIGKILEAGRFAPSPGSIQSLEFIVVESEDSLRTLATAASDPRLEEVPAAVVVLTDIERMKREVDEDARSACYAEASCGAHNMRLVAEEEGVSSCWITGFRNGEVESEFMVPEGKMAAGVVGLCYSEDEVETENRFGMNEVVFYDRYGNQLGSFFDSMEWEGLHEEKEKLWRKLEGAFWKARDRIASLI